MSATENALPAIDQCNANHHARILALIQDAGETSEALMCHVDHTRHTACLLVPVTFSIGLAFAELRHTWPNPGLTIACAILVVYFFSLFRTLL